MLDGWDGLHACCPKRDILPNADPGELNPKEGWPNEDGWLAAAATDPNNPLDAAVVEGEPKIDDVVLVTTGAPKMDEVVVEAEPNIELDDAELVGLPNIDELVVVGEPKTVVVCVGLPKPLVFIVDADPNIEDTVVAGVPNIDEVVFIEFPNIEDEAVEAEAPKIEDAVVVIVGVPNIDDVVVVPVGVPKIEEVQVLVVLAVVPKIDDVLVVLVVVLKIEEVLVVLAVLKIEVVLLTLVWVLKIDVWPLVLVEFPIVLRVFDELLGVAKNEEFVDGISKIGALLVIFGVVGKFSISGVTGSDIIGVGLSETWWISVPLPLVLINDTESETGGNLRTPKVEDGIAETVGSLIVAGIEKLNDAVTVVDVVEDKIFLVSDAVDFEISSLDALQLNVDNDGVSNFEWKVDKVTSFAGTVSWLFTDLSWVPNPVDKLRVSESFDEDVASKLKVFIDELFGLSILFLIDSAKLKVIGMLFFGTIASVFTLEKLKAVFSFDSVVPEIISKVDLDETVWWVLPKFKGLAVEGFTFKSTESLLEVSVGITLFPNNGTVLVELKTIGSLVNTL